MKINPSAVRQCLKSFDFKTLFYEHLGWDKHQAHLEVPVDGRNFSLTAIAQKRGFVAFVCRSIPDRSTRLKMDHEVTKSVREHFVIYADESSGQQVWHWVRREPGKPLASRDHRFDVSQSGDPLIQRLERIAVSMEEEEPLTLPDIAGRGREAFDVDKVTKKFYERFKAEHAAFLKLINGIESESDLQWYTSLMLNRLMFVYFIQKKGFLDGDTDYLRNRLAMVQRARGKDKFQSFYRYFLLRLFHDGLGKSAAERKLDPVMEKLLGKVPYLNGGFFEEHRLETDYPDIEIPDDAFAKLFDFFDRYSWHLDERPCRADNEINPDVVGYIFEKYINQKQMGAYYTKEDITEYISKNTIIPFLFDAARKKCAIAFKPDSALWRLLRDDPDRYIYPAVGHGVTCDYDRVNHRDHKRRAEPLPLPAEIEAGVKDVSKRDGWNKTAPPEYGLPTETWREVVARRQRCLDIREKLRRGEVREINDLVTLNLDIWQFARDAIVNAEGPELLRAFWHTLAGRMPDKSSEEIEPGMTILDPTCGSGAFLFAALRILETLYSDCLERMARFVEDDSANGKGQKYADFRNTLAQIGKHPNERYYILKSIIINNLFGVDIMEEAVEICKLRLFLKLVAQVETVDQIEPLPDIDFNIRAGNTLVGYATLDEIRKGAASESQTNAEGRRQGLLMLQGDAIKRIEEDAELVDRAFRQFRAQQVKHGGKVTAGEKKDLIARLAKLDDELDRYLAGEYGVSVEKKKDFDAWKASHQPFHWFVEFYGIMQAGGFDVIIGNPPYVVFSEDRVGYRLLPDAYRTFECKNLYGYVFERSLALASRMAGAGLIVQLTAMSAEKMASLQDILLNRSLLVCLPFPRRPESMFDGVEMPVVIMLSLPSGTGLRTSRINRFYTEERPSAILTTALQDHCSHLHRHRIAKLGNKVAVSALTKVLSLKTTLESITCKHSKHLLYYQEACRYWVKACKGYPHFKRNGETMPPPHGRILSMVSESACAFAACLMNSSLFYWWYSTLSDCEHVNDALVRRLPISEVWRNQDWTRAWNRLHASLEKSATRKTIRTKQGHNIEYQEINASLSKHIIDDIDRVLAKHYGFTDEELDFIINYDIKYRMGGNGREKE